MADKNFEVIIEQKVEFSPEELNDIIVTALEGGIDYWCRRVKIKVDKNFNYDGIAECDLDKVQFASDAIGYGGTLILFDAESPDRWELTPEKLLNGIKQYCEKQVVLADDIEGCDAGAADSIIQYALFNEITFG